jgi:hypothetical protein
LPKNAADITQAMTTFFQDQDVSPEERTAALAKMITGGAPVTGAMMQSLQPEQDLGPFLDKLGIKKDDPARVLWNMGALSRNQLGADLLRSFKAEKEGKEFDESLQTLFDSGLVKLDGVEGGIGADGEIRSEVEQLNAIAAYKEKYGQKAADVLMQKAGLMGDDTQWRGVLSRIDEGVPLEDMSATERALIVDKVKTPANRAALFGQKGDAAKMFEVGQRQILAQGEGLFGIWGLAKGIEAWSTGRDPLNIVTPQAKAYLDRNFDKFGNIKFDAMVEQGQKAFRAIEDLETRINISAEDWSQVEAILRTLQAIPESQIDWSLVEREIAKTGAKMADMQRWYQEIVSGSK